MDWVTEPHPLDPVIAAAVDHVAALLPSAIREAARVIESSPSGAVRLLTGFSEAQIEDLGGVPTKRGVPIINRRDVELAGFDYDRVLELGKFAI
jgi:hypothetical protein